MQPIYGRIGDGGSYCLTIDKKISLYDVRDTVIITILKELGKTDPEHGGYEATNMGHFLRVTNPQFLLCYDYSWRMLVLEWSIE
jgi:hypothetical protein